MRIAIAGSLAYDYIMTVSGYFTDHIVLAQDKLLMGSFPVASVHRMRGGNAGNIAYSLALLGERPLVIAAVGSDFAEYRATLDELEVETSGIVEIGDELTASCFIVTDKANREVHCFYAGAMARARLLSLLEFHLSADDLVVIPPSDPETIIHFANECRQLGVPYLLDPGRVTPQFEGQHLLDALAGAEILVGNDREFAMIAQKIGWTEAALIDAIPVTVITHEKHGSTVNVGDEDRKRFEIPAAPIVEMRDPTGAGDAYVAGLVFGLARGFPPPVAGRVAALMGAYAVQHVGCQSHRCTLAEFIERYTQVFGPCPELAGLAGSVN